MEGNGQHPAVADKAEKMDKAESTNPYLIVIQKKTRALKKKLEKIAIIEEKKAKGQQINQDQTESLASKAKSEILYDEYKRILSELEVVASQELKAEPKEEPKAKEEPPKPAESVVPKTDETPGFSLEQIASLLKLFFVSNFFDGSSNTGKEARMYFLAGQDPSSESILVRNENDIKALDYFSKLLTGAVRAEMSVEQALEQSLLHATKLLELSDDTVVPGVSYKILKAQVDEVVGSPYFQTRVSLATLHERVHENPVAETASAFELPPNPPIPQHQVGTDAVAHGAVERGFVVEHVNGVSAPSNFNHVEEYVGDGVYHDAGQQADAHYQVPSDPSYSHALHEDQYAAAANLNFMSQSTVEGMQSGVGEIYDGVHVDAGPQSAESAADPSGYAAPADVEGGPTLILKEGGGPPGEYRGRGRGRGGRGGGRGGGRPRTWSEGGGPNPRRGRGGPPRAGGGPPLRGAGGPPRGYRPEFDGGYGGDGYRGGQGRYRGPRPEVNASE